MVASDRPASAGSRSRRQAYSEARVREICAAHAGARGPLLPILHDIVEAFGFVDPRSVPVIADELNLSRAEVHGVVTFYRDFRTTPPGDVQVRICRAEACQSVGAETLVADAETRFGVKVGETTADGRLTLGEVFCLGNCALGPSAMIDDAVHGRMTGERLATLVAETAT